MLFRKRRNIDNMKFLTFAETETEACVLVSMLNSYGILTHMDYANLGGSLKTILGNSNMGINIYVLEEDYESASDLLDYAMDTVIDDDI